MTKKPYMDLHEVRQLKSEFSALLERVDELEKKEKDLAKKLRVSEKIKLNILNALPINIFLEDREGRTVFVNDQVVKAHGMKREELLGKTVFDFFPRHIAAMNRKVDEEVWRQRKLITKEIIGGFQGEERDLLTGKTVIQAENEDFLLGFALDITDRVNAEKMLRESEEKFRTVVDQAADGIFLIKMDGSLSNVNAAAAGMLGYKKEELLERNVSEIFQVLSQKLKEPLKCSESSESCHFEDNLAAIDGTRIPVDINLRLIHIGGKKKFLALGRDIRDKKKAEKAIQHMAFHDALTGLPNRWYIQSFMLEFFLKKGQENLGVILLDLDHFKVINDSMGHEAGDSLLIDVAERLRAVCKDGMIAARFGGDEFIILIPNIKSKEAALAVSGEIFSALEKPFFIGTQKVIVTASIGISISPEDGSELNELLRNADLAMYRSKDNGRNCCRLYDSSLNDKAVERMAKEIALHQALEKGEFLLHYQPKLDLETKQVYGFEALLRWRKGGKLLFPGQFIEVAEETGLIVQIGAWVMKEACRQCKAWHDQGMEKISVSVNLSPRQFQRQDLGRLIAEILEETSLPADKLELELTESTVMKEPERAAKVLGQLKSLGVSIAIDDFGTGFSSLSYLNRFPIDVLKIDRSFIKNLEWDEANASISSSVISLGQSLKLKIVAEGVESREQLSFLEEHSCNFVQGYYISRPLDAKSAASFIMQSHLPV